MFHLIAFRKTPMTAPFPRKQGFKSPRKKPESCQVWAWKPGLECRDALVQERPVALGLIIHLAESIIDFQPHLTSLPASGARLVLFLHHDPTLPRPCTRPLNEV